jgi:hypothetical protein
MARIGDARMPAPGQHPRAKAKTPAAAGCERGPPGDPSWRLRSGPDPSDNRCGRQAPHWIEAGAEAGNIAEQKAQEKGRIRPGRSDAPDRLARWSRARRVIYSLLRTIRPYDHPGVGPPWPDHDRPVSVRCTGLRGAADPAHPQTGRRLARLLCPRSRPPREMTSAPGGGQLVAARP